MVYFTSSHLGLIYSMTQSALPSLRNYCRNLISMLGSISRGIESAMLAFAAVVCAYLFVFVINDISIWDYSPFESDAISYLLQIRSAAHYGLASGAYGIQEFAAWFSPSPFGVHGPQFPLSYGTILAPFSWTDANPLLLNHILFGLALFYFLTRYNAGNLDNLLFTIFAVTYWPISLMLSICMQEAFLGSLALVSCGFLYKKDTSRRGFCFSMVCSIFSGITRPLYAFYLVAVTLPGPVKTWKRAIILLVGIGCSLVLSMLVFWMLSASPDSPFATGPSQERISPVIGDFIQSKITNGGQNLLENVKRSWILLGSYTVESHLIFVSVILVVFLICFSVPNPLQSDEFPLLIIFLWAIIINMIFYRVQGYIFFRMIGPVVLFLSPFILRKRIVIISLIIINFIYLPAADDFVKNYRARSFVIDSNHTNLRGIREILSQLSFDPLGDRWDNSIAIIDSPELLRYLPSLPVGFGFHVFRKFKKSYQPKCRYILAKRKVVIEVLSDDKIHSIADGYVLYDLRKLEPHHAR